MGVLSKDTVNFSALLTFAIAGEDYCLNNSIVTSIIKPDRICNISALTSKYSLLHIKSKFIPLIDLKKIFLGEEQKINSQTRAIIIEYREIQFGLLVEKVKEIIASDSDSLRTSGKFDFEENPLKYTDGTLKLESGKLLFVNIDRIIKHIDYF
jgi:purine-binding chemotaxis protein CheW